MDTLEAQHNVTLSAVLHTQHALTRSPFPEAKVFARMVQLLETALRSTSVSELRATQDEAEASRPTLRTADAEAGAASLEASPQLSEEAPLASSEPEFSPCGTSGVQP
ncbi:hypothetical protein [Deinococcus sp. QL22]|uniref:hypothetical protein n=1 Tax=Deinococcus sp. QL22 TaxID=2939437 RepID=UPI002017E617|nr:hypothetical protein [Deinococcus sp. QL22]UQN09343.1 hypothetical protein M1R55_22520 [Deinococcus sp. QL22]